MENNQPSEWAMKKALDCVIRYRPTYGFDEKSTIEAIAKELDSLKSQADELARALGVYADESNWGNGGYQGHPNDFFNPSRIKSERAWKIAAEALSNYRKGE